MVWETPQVVSYIQECYYQYGRLLIPCVPHHSWSQCMPGYSFLSLQQSYQVERVSIFPKASCKLLCSCRVAARWVHSPWSFLAPGKEGQKQKGVLLTQQPGSPNQGSDFSWGRGLLDPSSFPGLATVLGQQIQNDLQGPLSSLALSVWTLPFLGCLSSPSPAPSGPAIGLKGQHSFRVGRPSSCQELRTLCLHSPGDSGSTRCTAMCQLYGVGSGSPIGTAAVPEMVAQAWKQTPGDEAHLMRSVAEAQTRYTVGVLPYLKFLVSLSKSERANKSIHKENGPVLFYFNQSCNTRGGKRGCFYALSPYKLYVPPSS